MATMAQLEVLDGALSAYLYTHRVEWDGRRETSPACAEARLFGAAVDCGMPCDEPSVSEWAAERVTRWLCAA